MGFVRVPGLPGKVYVPDPEPETVKKHPCPDCHHCQGCGELRCRTCRSRENGQESDCQGPHS